MQKLRRFRVLFAAVAILVSPGGLTPWLQFAHACGPESAEHSMAGMDHAAMAGHAGHQMPETDNSGPNHHLQHCICVGACATTAVVATAARTTIAVIPTEFRAPIVRPVATFVQAEPQHAHPYAHAPPRHT